MIEPNSNSRISHTFALLIATLFVAVLISVVILLRLLSPKAVSPVAVIPTPTPAPAITITLPAPGSIVTSPLLIRGQLDHNALQQVTIRLYDENNLVKELVTEVQAIDSARPYIQTTMIFDQPSGSRGYLEVVGPSGSPLTPIRVPVYFTQIDNPNTKL